nr:hypothetical protein [Tanacetum cinerariifolium]
MVGLMKSRDYFMEVRRVIWMNKIQDVWRIGKILISKIWWWMLNVFKWSGGCGNSGGGHVTRGGEDATRISPRTLNKRHQMENEDFKSSELEDETEFEEQDIEKEKWILVTLKMIKDMIRIPMGSIAVTDVPATTTEFPHIVEWRQTYNTYTDARNHKENKKRIQIISRIWRTTSTHGENELGANLEGNVGGGGNENESEANLDRNVGEGSNENELIFVDTLNVTPEENLESNLENNKKGDDCNVDVGNSVDEGKETNLDEVLKEGDNDISKRDKENTLRQILTKTNTKKSIRWVTHQELLLSEGDETDESPQDDVMDDWNRVVGIVVAHSLQEETMMVGRKESPVTRSMDAQMEKAKTGRITNLKGHLSNTFRAYVSVEYMNVERNEKGNSAKCQQNVDNNEQTIIQNEYPIRNDVNVDVITKKQQDIIFKTSNMEVQRVAFKSMHEGFTLTKAVIDVWSIIQNNDKRLKNKMRSKYLFCKAGMTISRNFEDFKRKFEEAIAYTNQTSLDKLDFALEVNIIDNKKEESQDIVRRYREIPKRLVYNWKENNK